ncbi:hypothetical protein PC115_g18647 [Phytophthora cactorum]|uniref:Uncharacterized protein n=1 Tax=Phytophthora cactorum TaxID=29920 RepID=A0A8T1B4C8_9STRA|nr:hypothetical protein PC115_g18647 [Phytophthora cactorum]KAG3136603.1 hypothetical protein C6341_g21322 [Phytophthora cactorum]
MAADTTSTTTRGRPAVVMDALGHKRTGAATEAKAEEAEEIAEEAMKAALQA